MTDSETQVQPLPVSEPDEDGTGDESTPTSAVQDSVQDEEALEVEALDELMGDEEENEAPRAGDGTADRPGLEKSIAVRDTHLKSILESLIFVADKPVTIRQLAKAAKTKSAEVQPLIAELVTEYEKRGVQLVEVASGFQFRSAVVNAPFVRDFVARRPVRLTRAQLETLAIVSYRQPVTRPEVDDIRGVDTGSALRVLLERSLLKVLGRKDEPGRPLLYGTSQEFLEFFGLKSLKELPTLKEFTELSDESRGIFEKRLGEPLDLSQVEEAAKAAEAEAQEAFYDAETEEDEQEDREGDEGVEEAAVGEEDGDEADDRPRDRDGDDADDEDDGDADDADDDDADDDEDDEDDGDADEDEEADEDEDDD